MPGLEVSYVPPDQIDRVWTELLPMIEKALQHGQGDHTSPWYLRKAIERGQMMLWAVHDDSEIYAGLVLEMLRHPMKKTVFVTMLVGREMDRWIDLLESHLIAYRDLNNADNIEASVRDGLVRYLGKRGWSRKATIMEGPA